MKKRFKNMYNTVGTIYEVEECPSNPSMVLLKVEGGEEVYPVFKEELYKFCKEL